MDTKIDSITARLDTLESVMDNKWHCCTTKHSKCGGSSAATVTSHPSHTLSVAVTSEQAALNSSPQHLDNSNDSFLLHSSAAPSLIIKAHPQPSYRFVKGDLCTLLRDWYTKHLAKAVWEDPKEKQMMLRVLHYIEKQRILPEELTARLTLSEPKNALSPEHGVWEAAIASASSETLNLLLKHIFKQEQEHESKARQTALPSAEELSKMLQKRKFSDGISGIDSRISKLNKQQDEIAKPISSTTITRYLQTSGVATG